MDKKYVDELRQRLKEYIGSEPISQVNLAKEIGISPATLSYFLLDRKPTSNIVYAKINKFLKSKIGL